MTVPAFIRDDERAQRRLRELEQAGAWRTRFAPAPTGHLHLGHLVNAVHVWGIARAFGGQVVLRIEDHDRSRGRAEYEASILDDLAWLGFEPDIGSFDEYRQGANRYRQSDNAARYEDAFDRLSRAAPVYACQCSRRDIAALTDAREHEEPRYPGTCRGQRVDEQRTSARRVVLTDGAERFEDLRLGAIVQRPAQQCGDLLVRDRLGQWTYQFAVVVDDIAHGIDLVIRGEDLLESTGRQLHLARLLGRTAPPTFLHHALVRRPDGTKLSKSNHDTGLRELRAQGYSPEQLLGMAARASALAPSVGSLAITDLPALFRND